jgi:hypothetical protein
MFMNEMVTEIAIIDSVENGMVEMSNAITFSSCSRTL